MRLDAEFTRQWIEGRFQVIETEMKRMRANVGQDGADGTNGTNGTNGINGTNGTNGEDGTIFYFTSYAPASSGSTTTLAAGTDIPGVVNVYYGQVTGVCNIVLPAPSAAFAKVDLHIVWTSPWVAPGTIVVLDADTDTIRTIAAGTAGTHHTWMHCAVFNTNGTYDWQYFEAKAW